jgi:capsular polysaccharide biosynthesis protein
MAKPRRIPLSSLLHLDVQNLAVRIVTRGGQMRFVLPRHIEQVLRRWWIVLLTTAVALLAAVLPFLSVHTKYVSQATLLVSSPDRAPEQDARVVVGYATVFNNPATIDRLKAAKRFPQDVTFEARTVAASPILTIEATADDPRVAQEAATSMAGAFRDDVNSAQRASAVDAIANLQQQVNDVRQRFPAPPNGQPSELETEMQQQINKLQFDETNQLRDLQLRGGVTPVAPNIRKNVALGVAGGLMLGIVAALAMAAVSTRVGNSEELLEKTGIEPLVELPGGGSRRARRMREDRLRTLANFLSTQISARPTVVALLDSRGVEAARDIADRLSKTLAQQEYRTVFIDAEEGLQATVNTGFDDVLRDSGLVRVLLKDGELDTLKILPRGEFFTNRYSRITRARIDAVLDELRGGADAVVVASPSLAQTADAQLLCAAADVTIVVVDARSSRADDVSSVVRAVEKAGAVVIGAVLTNGSKRQSAVATIVPRRERRRTGEMEPRRGTPADAVVSDLYQ